MKATTQSIGWAVSLLVTITLSVAGKAQDRTDSTASAAQSYSAPSQAYVTGTGYWDLHTDHKQLSTTVRFYNADNQLIHQENFPGQYIKLTPKNTRAFDRLLNQLLTQSLVHPKVKPTPFPPVIPARPSPASETKESRQLYLTAFPVPNGKIKLVFLNPDRERINVKLENQAGKVMLEMATFLAQYHQNLVLSSLPEGVYRLSIGAKRQQYVRFLQIRRQPATPHIHFFGEAIQ